MATKAAIHAFIDREKRSLSFCRYFFSKKAPPCWRWPRKWGMLPIAARKTGPGE
jgi:hypothetical protein